MPDEQLAGQDTPAVTGEVQNLQPEQQTTGTTEARTDGAEGGNESPAAAKTFTQSELDEIIKREKSKAEAKAERRVLRTLERVIPTAQGQQPQQQQRQQQDGPRREQYQSDEDYLDAKLEWKLSQRDQQSAQQRQQEQQQTIVQKTEKAFAEASAVPGFDREAFDELPLTRPMVEALLDSDQRAQVMAYMSSHPEEVARVAGMSAARQAAELGKWEAHIAAQPKAKTSKAPDPISPIGSGKTPVHTLASASVDDYIAMRKKQGAAWAR
jgi:hypothetical protein